MPNTQSVNSATPKTANPPPQPKLPEISNELKEQASKQLLLSEGNKTSSYVCTAGRCTVGPGVNLDSGGGRELIELYNLTYGPSLNVASLKNGSQILSQLECSRLLDLSVRNAVKTCIQKLGEATWKSLTLAEQVQLIDIVHNNPSLLGKILTTAIKEGRWVDVIEDIINNCGTKRHPELLARRLRNADPFKQRLPQAATKPTVTTNSQAAANSATKAVDYLDDVTTSSSSTAAKGPNKLDKAFKQNAQPSTAKANAPKAHTTDVAKTASATTEAAKATTGTSNGLSARRLQRIQTLENNAANLNQVASKINVGALAAAVISIPLEWCGSSQFTSSAEKTVQALERLFRACQELDVDDPTVEKKLKVITTILSSNRDYQYSPFIDTLEELASHCQQQAQHKARKEIYQNLSTESRSCRSACIDAASAGDLLNTGGVLNGSAGVAGGVGGMTGALATVSSVNAATLGGGSAIGTFAANSTVASWLGGALSLSNPVTGAVAVGCFGISVALSAYSFFAGAQKLSESATGSSRIMTVLQKTYGPCLT